MTFASHVSGFKWGFLMILSATLCTFTAKAQYSLRAEGSETCVDIHGQPTMLCLFDKPWFGALEMKVGMACCLLVVYIGRFFEPCEELAVKRSTIWWLLIPATTDTLCTILGNVGLLWIAPSISEMVRGSMLVFNALLLVLVLRRRLFIYQYLNITLVVAAVTVVAAAGVVQAHPSSQTDMANQVLGFSCIILSRFVAACQIVLEEWLLTEHEVAPAVLVGWEGLWGLVQFILLGPLLMLSSADSTGVSKIWHEDFQDTWIKLTNSPSLVLTVSIYSFFMGHVTKHLTSVMTTSIQALHIFLVWLVALGFCYIVGWTDANTPGEPWTRWGWLELAGFGLLIVGTLMYKKVIRLPVDCLYDDEVHSKLEETSPLIQIGQMSAAARNEDNSKV
ncbi:hypothetical protein AeRB84_015072 [Aphanomyces euteiches]|nr:hypothetical protein AeRB84_015072 [Aphanomyces euteiches]